MNKLRSDDAEIVYEVLGDGPPVVLLHPFPASRQLWLPAAQALSSRYRVILPDLRGHGESEVGEGPATMQKHAADLAHVLDHTETGRAVFAGISIGGYILFEFWRRFCGRVAGLILLNTRASADTPEARTGRLQAANQVLETGVEPFVAGMLPKLMGETTHRTRPDLVAGARAMMMKMSAEDVAQVQRGMAERPDSMETLAGINVPTLVVAGAEDTLTPVADAERMRQGISGSQLKVIAKAGHYAAWEQPEEVGRLLRQFVDGLQ